MNRILTLPQHFVDIKTQLSLGPLNFHLDLRNGSIYEVFLYKYPDASLGYSLCIGIKRCGAAVLHKENTFNLLQEGLYGTGNTDEESLYDDDDKSSTTEEESSDNDSLLSDNQRQVQLVSNPLHLVESDYQILRPFLLGLVMDSAARSIEEIYPSYHYYNESDLATIPFTFLQRQSQYVIHLKTKKKVYTIFWSSVWKKPLSQEFAQVAWEEEHGISIHVVGCGSSYWKNDPENKLAFISNVYMAQQLGFQLSDRSDRRVIRFLNVLLGQNI